MNCSLNTATFLFPYNVHYIFFSNIVLRIKKCGKISNEQSNKNDTAVCIISDSQLNLNFEHTSIFIYSIIMYYPHNSNKSLIIFEYVWFSTISSAFVNYLNCDPQQILQWSNVSKNWCKKRRVLITWLHKTLKLM